MNPLTNCPPLVVGVQDEERGQQGLGKQPGRRGGQPASPRGGRARTDGHQRRLHPQVRMASGPPAHPGAGPFLELPSTAASPGAGHGCTGYTRIPLIYLYPSQAFRTLLGDARVL